MSTSIYKYTPCEKQYIQALLVGLFVVGDISPLMITYKPCWPSNFKLALGDEGEGLQRVWDELVDRFETTVFYRTVRYEPAVHISIRTFQLH